MTVLRQLCLTAIIVLWAGRADTAVLSPSLVNPANGHHYLLLEQNTWPSSQNEAILLGGHLATVNDQAEEDWIFATFGQYGATSRLLWIGWHDLLLEGRFAWASAQDPAFTAWGPGEPNSIPGEDYVAIYYPGHSTQNRWNDWGLRSTDPIGLPINGVVEIDPTNILVRLVPFGARWKFLENGSDPGPTWVSPDYQDSGWRVGFAQLGYGGDGEATLVSYGPDPAQKHITTWFRHQFLLEDARRVARVSLRLLRDDGAVVYLNGAEVARGNLPTGPLSPGVQALVSLSDSEEKLTHSYSIDGKLLLDGTNTVAVEVHQASPSSSDLSFDLEMIAWKNSAPAIHLISPTNRALLAAGKTVHVIANAADDQAVTRVDFYANSTRLGEDLTNPFAFAWASPAPGAYTLTAVARDSAGLTTTSAPIQIVVQPALLARGALWSYLDTGVNQGSAWLQPEFDDTAWPRGLAQLGYGDGDESTVINFGPSASSKYPTTYFRRSFEVAAPGIFTNLVLRLLRDDGAVVYLNGLEVWRDNLPTAQPITFSTLAMTALGSPQENLFESKNLAPSLLVPGTNLLAIEVHQASLESTDLSFDLELIGELDLQPPTLQISRAGSQLRLSWQSAGNWQLEAGNSLAPDEAWTPVGYPLTANGQSVETLVTPLEAQRFFRLRATDR